VVSHDARVLVAADLLPHPFSDQSIRPRKCRGAVVRLRRLAGLLKLLRDRDLARGASLWAGRKRRLELATNAREYYVSNSRVE
jgi:hypothetical protein